MNWIAEVVDLANEKLRDDRQAAIGPSYFMKEDILDEEYVRRVWDHSVLPYVEEQIFATGDDLQKYRLERLRKEIKEGNTQDVGSSQTDADSGNDVAQD